MVTVILPRICVWAQARATNGFLAVLNGLFQVAKHKVIGYGQFSTIRTVIFRIAGKRDCSRTSLHMTGQPA
ncbi:hypothetical protein A9R16_007315 [Acidiferrobacter thiooxydans]|jgi:hypothetical protein|uniref:Uncharacterized protein n=1 Tax=Acidiferrobacter thiooxydans TaxID=163359 RepID=A0A1C2FYE6_9GAMM|nr:hypothetical protein C4900_06955 [Acidiferrobacter thiooxydans]UEO01198.1 hypothetical protein A9R16_007315 [Acidiferrobacter thiooxydans]